MCVRLAHPLGITYNKYPRKRLLELLRFAILIFVSSILSSHLHHHRLLEAPIRSEFSSHLKKRKSSAKWLGAKASMNVLLRVLRLVFTAV